MNNGSQNDDFGAVIDYQTARGRDYPAIRQFTVFLENRVGALSGVLRRFRGSSVRILSLHIHDSADCSILRCILSQPEKGREILERAGLAMIESDLIGICSALLQAEVNLLQSYTLMVQNKGCPVVAIMVDNIDQAQVTLESNGLKPLSEDELQDLV